MPVESIPSINTIPPKQAAALLDDWMQILSHDLRAPLRHFTAYGQLVRETLQALPAQGSEVQEALGFLSTMDRSARRMGLMMDGLMALAQASRVPLLLVPVDMAAVVANARTALAPSEAGRVVAWDVEPGLPVLQADTALIQLLVHELLANALKFTRAQPVARIAVRAEAAADGTVAFIVQDNGAGFDPTRAASLFGVFQRLHRETEFEGVGAGLALCRCIAERHGAQIRMAAAVNQGCVARVESLQATSG